MSQAYIVCAVRTAGGKRGGRVWLACGEFGHARAQCRDRPNGYRSVARGSPIA